MASDNASMDLLIKSMVRLLDRFVVCDLENDRYRFYNLQGEMIYAPIGTYHDFVEQVAAKYKTLEPLDGLAALISPENIRRNLQDENDIYKFEYCSIDETPIRSLPSFRWSGMAQSWSKHCWHLWMCHRRKRPRSNPIRH